MKRIVSIILTLVIILSFSGCQKAMYDETDYIEKARKEFNIHNAENIDLQFIGEVANGDKALLWFISGNEHQAHNYLPMSCSITEDKGRVFETAHSTLNRGTDIVVVVDWCNGYAFCVNNPKCKTIKIKSNTEEREVEVTEYPFIYFSDLFPDEYSFLDEDGEAIS